jgi:hypothetical protein
VYTFKIPAEVVRQSVFLPAASMHVLHADDALDPSSPEEEEDEEDSGSAAEAGVARALVRSLAKLSPNFVTIYRSLFVGQLPR